MSSKGLFAFGEEIVEQYSESFMRNLDVDPLFTNIPLEKTIDFYANTLFENAERI